MVKRFKRVRISRRKRKKTKDWKKILLIWFVVFLFVFLIPIFWLVVRFKKNILDTLPDLTKIEKLQLAQTTIITDRNWKVLYKLFEQNRRYVNYNQISPNLVNAVIATEDKNFWTNPWIDIQGIIRAAIYDITHPWGVKQWWSTITQQLIKNLLLTPQRTIDRKLKEIVLAIKLNKYLKEKEKKLYPNLTPQQLDKKIKEKILELYLNYIFLGNNSRWVEAASETYFWKHAKELNILESAILAALPKAPSYYDPVKYPWRNLWYLTINCGPNKKYFISLSTWQVFSW